MRYLSLFSGIEACTAAWHGLGWSPVAFAEIEAFPSAVLKHHFPNVPNLGDVTKITTEQIKALGPFELLVGGSPCQDLSVAGRQRGLINEDGSLTRSGLFTEQMRIFEDARKNNGCRFMLWENVPGAFSSNGGADFATVLGTMVRGCVSVPKDGWANAGVCVSRGGGRIVEWRTLDARYFGVAQRRRRVFALLDTGAWYSRPPILFEQECVFGNFTQSQSEWERTTRGTCQSPSHDNQMERGTDLKAYDVRLTADGTNEASKRANVYETDIARTVDRDGNQPHHQQGGVLVFSRPGGGCQ